MNTNYSSYHSPIPPSSISASQSSQTTKVKHIKVYKTVAHTAIQKLGQKENPFTINVSNRDERGWLTKFIDLFRGKSVVKIQLSNHPDPIYAKTNDLSQALGISKGNIIKQEANLGSLIEERSDLFIEEKVGHKQRNAIKSELESLRSQAGKIGKIKQRLELQKTFKSYQEHLEIAPSFNPSMKEGCLRQLEKLKAAFDTSSPSDLDAKLDQLYELTLNLLSLQKKLDTSSKLTETEKMIFYKKTEEAMKTDTLSLSSLRQEVAGLTDEVSQTIELAQVEEKCQSLHNIVNLDKEMDETTRKEFLERIQKFQSKSEENPASLLKEATKKELAQLEKEINRATQRLHTAATKIQKIFRGFRARNQLIQKYVEKNFDVRSNVPSLSQAKVIYMGERHTVEGHAVRNAWIINHMFKKGDRVLVEDESGERPWIKAKTDQDIIGQVRYVRKEIEMWGWDYKSDKVEKSLENIFFLGDALTLFDKFLDPKTPETKKKPLFDSIIKKLKKISSIDLPSNYLNNTQLVEKAFQEIPKEFITALLDIAYEATGKELMTLVHETMIERQASLVNRVTTTIQGDDERTAGQKEYQKVFLIAGKAHLIQGGKQGGEIEENLAPSLQNHKYAILIPKHSKGLSEADQNRVAKLLAKKSAKAKAPKKLEETTNTDEMERLAAFVKKNSGDRMKFLTWLDAFLTQHPVN